MKIVNVTLAVTGEEGTETKVTDPNFAVGRSYAVPEIGPGLWTVEEVGEPSTNFLGGRTVATTRVRLVPAAPDAVETASATGSFEAVRAKHDPRPTPKAVKKPRHTPR